jgi:hypothetical protein
VPQCGLERAATGYIEADGHAAHSDFCYYHRKVMAGLCQPQDPLAYGEKDRQRVERSERARLEALDELLARLG